MSIKFKYIRNSSLENGVLTFGKYRGCTYKDLQKTNPDYLLWCVRKNIISITLNEEIQLNLAARNYVNDDCSYRKSKKSIKYDNRYGMMPDYDTDMLGDWFDDVPF